jgi:hypothetical protein
MVPTTTEKSQKPTEQEPEKDSAAAKATLLDLFRPKKILWRTICMFYNWMVIIILHYTYHNFDSKVTSVLLGLKSVREKLNSD